MSDFWFPISVWCLMPDVWYLIYIWCLMSEVWCLMSDVRRLVSRSQMSDVWCVICLVSDVRRLMSADLRRLISAICYVWRLLSNMSGVWCQMSDVWCLKSYVWCQEVRCQTSDLWHMSHVRCQTSVSDFRHLMCDICSLVPTRRSLLIYCPRESLGDVTDHGRVQELPSPKCLGTRLWYIYDIWCQTPDVWYMSVPY